MTIRNALLTFVFLATACLAVAGEPWRPGHLYCPDAAKATADGVVPPGARIILEDGSAVDISSLQPDDAFKQLVDRWVKVRNGYHSDPTLVNNFVYKLDSLNLGPGVRSVEIWYVSNGVIGKRWKGTTHIIKAD